MNKRQRKKRLKKKLARYYYGVDLANGNDFTAIPSVLAEFIYKSFNIPKEVMNKGNGYPNLQYHAFLNMNRVVLHIEDDSINGTNKDESKGIMN